MSARILASCLALGLVACGKSPTPQAEPTVAAPSPAAVPAMATAAQAATVQADEARAGVPAPVAASPTVVAPDLPAAPQARVEDGTVVLRGRGDKGRFGVEIRFRQPDIGSLFTAMTKITDLASGAAVPGATFTLDATMPEHRHGMMTRPIHKEISPGAWRSEGMKLHMHGHWVFDATVDVGGVQDTVHIPWEQPSL